MKAGTQNHLKTKRLMRLLGIPLYRAVGILETLWLLCADCCDEGDIGKYTDEEIADYLGWDGPSASELVRHLSDSGWIDRDNEHRLLVHDWIEHCPEYIRDRIRKRSARQSKRRKQRTYVSSKSDKSGQSRTDTGRARSCPVYSQPNPTQPNRNGMECATPDHAIPLCEISEELVKQIPELQEASKIAVFPKQSKQMSRGAYRQIKDEHLPVVANMVEWHAKQLSISDKVAGNTEADLLCVLACAMWAMQLQSEKVKSTRSAAFVYVHSRKNFRKVSHLISDAAKALSEFRERTGTNGSHDKQTASVE